MPAAKKPAAPKKTATSKNPAVSVEKAEPQVPADPKQVVTGWSVKGYPIVKVEAPAAPTVEEKPIEKVEPQDLSSKCSEVEKLLEFLLISKKLQTEPPYVEFCNDLTELLSDCVDDEGKLLIQVKPSRPTKRTQSKVNGSSALRAFWAELIDRPEGATREELFEGGKAQFPDLSPRTMMSQLSQLRLGYNYGVSIHPEYSGRKAKEVNGVYNWLPAEETVLEDYRLSKKEKTVGPIEMIGSDGRVWAGVRMVG